MLAWWTGTKRDLLSGDPRPQREEETQTRGQATARQEYGRCSTDLSRLSGPSLPFSEQNRPPKPSRADGKAGTRLQSSAALQGSFPTSVASQERHFDTSRSLLCSHLRKPQAETPRWLPALARARRRAQVWLLAAAAACQHSPLNCAQLQLKCRFKDGSYKNPSLRLEKLLRSTLWGPQAAAPAMLTGRKVHAGFLHKCMRVQASLCIGPSTSEC